MMYGGIMAVLCNAWFREKGKKAFTPYDFLPESDRPKVTISAEDRMLQIKMALSAAAIQGGASRVELPPQAPEPEERIVFSPAFDL